MKVLTPSSGPPSSGPSSGPSSVPPQSVPSSSVPPSSVPPSSVPPSSVPSSPPSSSPQLSTFDRLEHAKDDFKRNICHQIDQLFGALLAELNIVNVTQSCDDDDDDDDNSKALDLTLSSCVKQEQQNILVEGKNDLFKQQQNDDDELIQKLPLNLSVVCVDAKVVDENQKKTKRSLEQLNKNVLETPNTKKHCCHHSTNSSDSRSNIHDPKSNISQNNRNVVSQYQNVPQNPHDSRKSIDSRNILDTSSLTTRSIPDSRFTSVFQQYKRVPQNNLDSRSSIVSQTDIRNSRSISEPQNIPETESRNSILYQAKVVPQGTSAAQNIHNSRNSIESHDIRDSRTISATQNFQNSTNSSQNNNFIMQNNNTNSTFESFSPIDQSDPNILAEIKQEILEEEEEKALKNKEQLLNETTFPNVTEQKQKENVLESLSSSSSPSSSSPSSSASTSDDHTTQEHSRHFSPPSSKPSSSIEPAQFKLNHINALTMECFDPACHESFRSKVEHSRHSSPSSSKPSSSSSSIEQTQLKLNHINALTMECFDPSCHESFRSKVEHSRHMRDVHGLCPILCPVTSCGRSYRNLPEWKLHAAHRHPKMNHCSICSKSFTNVHALYGHVIEEHQKGQFVCPNSKSNCTYIGDYLGDVAVHLKTCDHGREDGELPQSLSNHFDQNLMVLKCRECDGATLLNPNDLPKYNISEEKIRNYYNIDPKVRSLAAQCFYSDCRSSKIFRETKYLIQHANDAHVLCHCGEPVPDKGRFEKRWDRRV